MDENPEIRNNCSKEKEGKRGAKRGVNQTYVIGIGIKKSKEKKKGADTSNKNSCQETNLRYGPKWRGGERSEQSGVSE